MARRENAHLQDVRMVEVEDLAPPDLSQLLNNLYTASYDAVNELYRLSLNSEEGIPAARDYWESCKEYEPGREASGEILVEGSIPPSAIIAVFEG